VDGYLEKRVESIAREEHHTDAQTKCGIETPIHQRQCNEEKILGTEEGKELHGGGEPVAQSLKGGINRYEGGEETIHENSF
jgi:hypothetical protein